MLAPEDGRVAMITMDPSRIGAMSCNPAIGGLAKGQMVCEIDAMGGLMGMAADVTGIQFRVLNQTKGPAVRGPRCQSDKYRYAEEVQRLLGTRRNLDILAGTVEKILVENHRVVGVIHKCGSDSTRLASSAVVLTTGTFMRGLMHTGESQTEGGRVGEDSAVGISGALRELGFELGRLKTGTPPRLAAETIDFSGLEEQPGDVDPTPFSDEPLEYFPAMEQRVCWLTETNQTIHDAIHANLDRAPMYNGQIETAGPRYCPSIEDKVVRFADRSSHHVFLEPESLGTNEIYCNGISTSLPADVQETIVANMPGCEKAKILQHGYAVEYDMVWPHQIDATCMTKHVEGFFLAGQINGTSGYEEAAGQGLIAGVNAVNFTRGDSMFRLRRDQAYIGVMMDDLVTKTPREPYRMFTSRAEFRLLLRSDNADERLTLLARELGLVDGAKWDRFNQRIQSLDVLREFLSQNKEGNKKLIDWVRAPQVQIDDVLQRLNGDSRLPAASRDRRLVSRLLADVQYSGFIERQRQDIARLASQENVALPADFDYTTIGSLRNEAATTLNRFQPTTLGQAGRLAGVTPADVMLLAVAIKC